jgi:hypothetical protein
MKEIQLSSEENHDRVSHFVETLCPTSASASSIKFQISCTQLMLQLVASFPVPELPGHHSAVGHYKANQYISTLLYEISSTGVINKKKLYWICMVMYAS